MGGEGDQGQPAPIGWPGFSWRLGFVLACVPFATVLSAIATMTRWGSRTLTAARPRPPPQTPNPNSYPRTPSPSKPKPNPAPNPPPQEFASKRAKGIPAEIKSYPGQPHGFSLRGNVSTSAKAASDAFDAGIAFLKEHLAAAAPSGAAKPAPAAKAAPATAAAGAKP